MYICTNCLGLNTVKINRQVKCRDCAFTQSIISYNSNLRIAKHIVRLGFQYRKRLEYDSKRNPNVKKSYYLKELHDAFAFLGLAVISGIAGNFAYDKLLQVLKRIINEPLIIEINDKELQSFLKSELQQKKFIKYIEEYRHKKMGISKKTTNNKITKKKATAKVQRKKNYR